MKFASFRLPGSRLRGLPLLVAGLLLAPSLPAQDRLKEMPGYERFQKVSKEIPGSVKLGTLNVTWRDGGSSFDFPRDGKRFHYDIGTGKLTDLATNAAARPGTNTTAEAGRRGRRANRGGGPERGRQFSSATSPDGKLKAFFRDRNLWLSDANGSNTVAITSSS